MEVQIVQEPVQENTAKVSVRIVEKVAVKEGIVNTQGFPVVKGGKNITRSHELGCSSLNLMSV